MKTIILMWDPAVSTFTLPEFTKCLHALNDPERREHLSFNWSVFDWKDTRIGDRFYLVRVGEGPTGVVMSGMVASEPYREDDWSGKGRETHYVDLDVEAMVDSDKAQSLIRTADLMEQLPGFDWTGGHSGRTLPARLVKGMDLLWDEYVKNAPQVFDGEQGVLLPEKMQQHQQPKYLVRGFDSFDFEYYPIKLCNTYEEAMAEVQRVRRENQILQCSDPIDVRMIR